MYIFVHTYNFSHNFPKFTPDEALRVVMRKFGSFQINPEEVLIASIIYDCIYTYICIFIYMYNYIHVNGTKGQWYMIYFYIYVYTKVILFLLYIVFCSHLIFRTIE